MTFVAGTARRRVAGFLEDAALLGLVVVAVPLVILLIGTPIVLCVRAIAALAHWL